MTIEHSLSTSGAPQRLAAGFRGVRYQVADVARSVAFYTERLGFTLEHQQLPAFASVSLGPLQLLLSGPGASGSRTMPERKTRRYLKASARTESRTGLVDTSAH